MGEQNYTIHGLRGMASLLVVFYHIYGMAYLGGFFEKRDVEGFFIIFHNFGAMGVNLFFIISGYLIIGSLARHGNVKSFIINRIIRIYPVFLILHLIIFLVGPVINYEWLGEVDFKGYVAGFLSNLFFLPGIFNLPIAQKNAWSLSYEFTFYIVSALFFLVILRLENRLLKVVSFSLLILLSCVIIYFHNTAMFFVLGVIIFYAEDIIKSKYSYKKYFTLNGIVMLPVIFYIYNQYNIILILALSLILFWIVVNEEGLLSKILRHSVFQFLGTISYSLYLIHPLVLFPLKIIFSTEQLKMIIVNEYVRITLFGLMGLVFAIIGSYISFKLIEDKFGSKLKSLVKEKSIRNNRGVKNLNVS
ncbi:acyltransferase family protein [Guptibacillus hwajinpoensis]|uniref:Acyltransferase 3 domain-containing protein n=1 Tax=Guptibacillus hwajinpoensis TaxID=208199 RepID=A0A0J6CU84_9BACL|nr:acyltransferase [Alkalihalobacillus macyae]KMM36753.1 hypothetical protein AB986_12490 [Alkalihalobacillus macyae]